jgi:hypothetical protein
MPTLHHFLLDFHRIVLYLAFDRMLLHVNKKVFLKSLGAPITLKLLVSNYLADSFLYCFIYR